MRVTVEIDESRVRDLDGLAARQGRPRAALIREAVADSLRLHREQVVHDAFGLWGRRKTDGLAYQRMVRNAW